MNRLHTVAICANAIGERPTGNPPRTGGLYRSGTFLVYLDEDDVVHLGAQTGAEPVALADKVDAEFKRVWDTLNSDKVIAAPVVGVDAGEPGLTLLQTEATIAAA